MVRATTVPRHSEIRRQLADAHFYDAFEVPIANANRSALEIHIDMQDR